MRLAVLLSGCGGPSGSPRDSAPIEDSAPTDDSSEPIDDSAEPTWSTDIDHDGYAPQAGDCDDADPAVSPAAKEVVGNGIDENCDGLDVATLTMEGIARTSELWAGRMGDTLAAGDLDGNAVADLAIGFPLSSPPDVTGLGEIDAGVETHLGPLEDLAHGTWHRGLEEDLVSWIGQGLAVGDTDGDGLDDLAYSIPGGDGLDFNTGLVYVVFGPATTATDPEKQAPVTIIGEERDQFFGYSMASETVDFDGDGIGDLVVGREAPDGDEPARAYVFAGPFAEDRMESEAELTVVADALGDRFGATLDAGDFDGDGHSDLLIGGYWSDVAGESSGQVWVMFGPASGTVSNADAGASFAGEAAGDYAGHSVASLGDVDHDGTDDLAVGALFASQEGERSGRAYVVHGPVSGAQGLGLADATFVAGWPGDWNGRAVIGTGDVTGDGQGDLVLSATQDPYNLQAFARVSLFAGPFIGEIRPEDAARIWVSPVYADLAGDSLSVGDFDGSGMVDVAVGAPLDSTLNDAGGRVTVMLDPFD